MSKMIRTRSDSLFKMVDILYVYFEDCTVIFYGNYDNKAYPLQIMPVNDEKLLIEYIPYEKYLKEQDTLQNTIDFFEKENERVIAEMNGMKSGTMLSENMKKAIMEGYGENGQDY